MRRRSTARQHLSRPVRTVLCTAQCCGAPLCSLLARNMFEKIALFNAIRFAGKSDNVGALSLCLVMYRVRPARGSAARRRSAPQRAPVFKQNRRPVNRLSPRLSRASSLCRRKLGVVWRFLCPLLLRRVAARLPRAVCQRPQKKFCGTPHSATWRRCVVLCAACDAVLPLLCCAAPRVRRLCRSHTTTNKKLSLFFSIITNISLFINVLPSLVG